MPSGRAGVQESDAGILPAWFTTHRQDAWITLGWAVLRALLPVLSRHRGH